MKCRGGRGAGGIPISINECRAQHLLQHANSPARGPPRLTQNPTMVKLPGARQTLYIEWVTHVCVNIRSPSFGFLPLSHGHGKDNDDAILLWADHVTPLHRDRVRVAGLRAPLCLDRASSCPVRLLHRWPDRIPVASLRVPVCLDRAPCMPSPSYSSALRLWAPACVRGPRCPRRAMTIMINRAQPSPHGARQVHALPAQTARSRPCRATRMHHLGSLAPLWITFALGRQLWRRL